jgi:hypothetical protein
MVPNAAYRLRDQNGRQMTTVLMITTRIILSDLLFACTLRPDSFFRWGEGRINILLHIISYIHE